MTSRWETHVLEAIDPWVWPRVFRSPARLLAVAIAAVLVLLSPLRIQIAVSIILLAAFVTYWVAFASKVGRKFREGYRVP